MPDEGLPALEKGVAMREEWSGIPGPVAGTASVAGAVPVAGAAPGVDGDTDYMDGNMLAGPLREVFAVELTGAALRCGNCGSTGPLAGLRVYPHAPGLVARCPTCLAVLLRLVREPTHAWLDLHGATYLRIPMPAEEPRF